MKKFGRLPALAALLAAVSARASEFQVKPIENPSPAAISVSPMAMGMVDMAQVTALTLPMSSDLAPNLRLNSAVAADIARPEALPSRDQLVRAHASRILREVFIQQEHEGHLLTPDPRDSSGNIFSYYAPEMRPEIAAQVNGNLDLFSAAIYKTRRLLQLGRGGAAGMWRAWPRWTKLAYLDALEKAVTVEDGPNAAWDGRASLILKKRPDAPRYLAEHPHMEAPSETDRDFVGARFLQPEIVTDKAHPAATVEEALKRTRTVIRATGHAGSQYHIFLKAPPSVLLAQMDRIDGAMQLFNNVLFARAVAQGEKNLTQPVLGPWHRGRSERVRRLLMEAAPEAHVSADDDDDSEKYASVALRYWGLEDGNAVISIELRAVLIPFVRHVDSGGSFAVVGLPERNFTEVRAQLTQVALFAEALARGQAPDTGMKSAVLNEAAAEAYMAERARALGLPEGAFDGLAAFSRRLNGTSKVPQGWLFPFAAAAPDDERLRALADDLVVLAARTKVVADSGSDVNTPYNRRLAWSAYAAWCRGFADEQEARLLRLARAAANRANGRSCGDGGNRCSSFEGHFSAELR